uniref:Collagen type IV alpha-3-binding protein n=1 Tax=Haemonchus placei TaxID=6290 RepID=A0A158QP79_HAEPC
LESFLDVLPSSGTLLKWTNYINGWRERFFEIKNGQLLYYASKADQASGCRGSISLKKLEVTLHEFNECEFSVSVGDVTWHLRAENPHSRTYWIKSDSDYCSNTTKTHSRNTSLSSLTLEQNTMVSRIAELEAYRTMYREQMSSIRRELQQIGVPQAKILSINATHVAMLDNINHIIQLAKNEVRFQSFLCSSSYFLYFCDCGDEWHDADEHSSLSLDSAEEAIERRTPPGIATAVAVSPPLQQMEKKTVIPVKIRFMFQTLLFGDYDNVLIPKSSVYYDLVDHLAKEQLRYALAGVENKVWTLFAEDGAMKMYTREETVDGGLPVDPLKAVHQVQGVSALEFMHYFFDDRYKMDWDHTLNGMRVVERISRDTLVILQKHKTVWPAASRESLFVSHIRRVDELKRDGAHDLYIVCNKDVTRADVPVTSSGIRVGLTVSMICETVIKNGKKLNEASRDDILCNVIYVSQVHPGGWVPTAALRQVYKREYPKFLRTFTSYVLKNVKGKPLSI